VSTLRVRSIRTKLALLIAASVGAAVFLSFAVSSYRELSRLGEAKRSELEATAEVLAATVADAVAEGNRGTAVRALNAISRIPAVRFAEIRTGGGALFAEAGTGVALSQGGATTGADTSFWGMLTRGSMFVTADVVKGGRAVGELIMLVDTSELYQRLKQALAAAALSAVGAVAIGFAIASRLQRSITRPLRALADTMNQVRLTSDFGQRAERQSDDETGQLVESFNTMLDQIRGRDQALEEHRAGWSAQWRCAPASLPWRGTSPNRQPGEIRLPGDHESRDPHPDERHAGHGGAAGRDGAPCPPAALRRDDRALRPNPAHDHQRHPRFIEDRSRKAGA
jgi:two-component system sensor histidine kinase BarA